MDQKIEIPVSKLKSVLLLFASFAFVICCIGILLIVETGLYEKVIAVIGILFFGLGFIVFPKRIFVSTPGITIDANGITDHITKPAVGLIEWGDITHIEISDIAMNKMLFIYVSNPEKYLDRVKGSKSQGLRNNYNMTGTPFLIPSSVLKIKLKDLEILINRELKKYRDCLNF